MAQCLNCTAEAGFRVEYPGAVHQVFCNMHLPYDLNEILPDFVIRLTNNIETVANEAVAEVKKSASKKSTTSEAPVSEAVADEAVADEAVAEAPLAD